MPEAALRADTQAEVPRSLIRLPSTPRPKGRRQTAPGPEKPAIQTDTTRRSAPTLPSAAHIRDSHPQAQVSSDSASAIVRMSEVGQTPEVGVARIKSVGSAPRRWTPTPAQSEYNRESIVAEWHDTRGKGDRVVYPTPPLSAVGSYSNGDYF